MLHIADMMNANGFYISTTVGTSMYPLLRNRRDTIIIRPCRGRLKKYDVPLYKRGSNYVLHRIVKVTQDGYMICGDNCLYREKDITDQQIIGVLAGITRGEKEIKMDGFVYQMYCRIWVALYPVRFICKAAAIYLRKMKPRFKKM